MLSFPCQICSLQPSNFYLTKCCKLFICQQCKLKHQSSSSNCVCLKPILNKKLCSQNQLLHKIICDYENKKEKQCDRCTELAEIQCKNCNMVFCKECEKELHSAIGYSKHVRETYAEKQREITEVIEQVRAKQKVCQNHRQLIEFVCQCSSFLCTQCIKPHKQTCAKLPTKPKPFSQYRAQFYSTLLYKLTQITTYKKSLQAEITQYSQYFTNQRQNYKITQKAIEEQFLTLKKMLELKMEQSQTKLNEYWQDCQRVYKKTLFYLENNLRKYDDYARLAEKFVENEIGLDYMEKRIKKVPPLNYNSFAYKVNSIQDVKNSILSISRSFKSWQFQFHQTIPLNLEEPLEQKRPSSMMKKSQILTSQPSELLYEISQNPLNPRPLQFSSSHNQIQFTFLHLPYHNFKYEIEYGVGFKMKGKEVFKKIDNFVGRGLIQGLNPSTKYRIRMRVGDGQFGEITEVTTLDLPKFYIEPGNIMKSTSENSFQFLKQGVIYGTNPIIFGIHYWTVILNSEKSSYDQSQTACITVGISNKQQKKPLFVGSTFNYGYQRDQIVVKLMVNCEEQTMTISTPQNNNQAEEKFSNLPLLPIFPAIQNKSSATIHIRYMFGKEEN